VQVMSDMLPEEFAALEAAYNPPAADIRGAAE
jgi:diacylglycerol O-acyltransferase